MGETRDSVRLLERFLGVAHRVARSLSSGAHSRDPLAPTHWLIASYVFLNIRNIA
jgi:hypothetical protein